MSAHLNKIIKIINGFPEVVEDQWIVVRDPEAQPNHSAALEMLSFSSWKGMNWHDVTTKPRALWLSPDDDFESCIQGFDQLALIAVDFPSFRDGRGYSIAHLLRTRYGWKGELRAIGDVLRDQLNYMRRCGFDAFAVRGDKSIDDALKGFRPYSVQYQGAVDQPLPLFRRR